jgi:hypothetical protein
MPGMSAVVLVVVRSQGGAVMKYPPYGKQAKAHGGEIRIYIGSIAWKNARIRNRYCGDALVMPDGELPECFSWPVHGADVLVLQAGALDLSIIPRLANVLAHAGATIVRAVYGEEMTIYRISMEAAA